MRPVSTEPPKAKQVAHVRPIQSQKQMLNTTQSPKHPTLVVPIIHKAKKHRYPVAVNGKLLDIAVIDEKPQPQLQPQSTKSAKVSSSGSSSGQGYPVAANGKLLDIVVIDEKPQSTKSAKVSSSGQEDSFCPKCSLECDDPWVFCPVCKIVIHRTCILTGCICNYKPCSGH